MHIEDIAKVCHEANRGICAADGDYSQVPWIKAPDWQKDSAVAGVSKHVAAVGETCLPMPPSASHESWMKTKLDNGWSYGPQKDVLRKRHPCIVAFEKLPPREQVKDFVFGMIVAALFEHLDEESA